MLRRWFQPRYAVVLIALLLALPIARSATPAEAQRAEIADTAWEIVGRGTEAEISAYFKHLGSVGFDAAWISLLSIDGWGFESLTTTGSTAGTIDPDGSLHLTAAHKVRVKFVLDEAQRNGIDITLAAIWGVGYLHGHWQTGACTNLGKGPLNVESAYGWGHEIGSEFAKHPAIARWLMGGDNFCTLEDGKIWAEVSRGLRDAGANQPIGYHTPAGGNRHFRYSDQSWHDFFAIQTSHCTPAKQAGQQLASVVKKSSGKPVFAAELRYEAAVPDWPGCIHHPGNPVDPDDIADDVRESLNAGVSGVVYGHNERWQWGIKVLGAKGDPLGSLGAPGERRALKLVRGGVVKPPETTPATTFAPTTTTTTTPTTVVPTSVLIKPTVPMPSSTISGLLPSTTTTTTIAEVEILCSGVVATMVGSEASDVLVGTEGDDVIAGLGGDDVIDGRGGNDIICGGDGDDRLLGGPGDDELSGGGGADLLRGFAGDDELRGAGGNDKLQGQAGNDLLRGGKGVDVLTGGPGKDSLAGGPGRDRLKGGGGRSDKCVDRGKSTKRKGCELP